MVSKKKYMASKAVIGCILFMLIMIVMPVTCHAAKYKGIDYSAVYDYKYYKGRFKYVREHYKTSYPALRYFVKFGMKRRQRASEDFSVNSYIYGNKDLRRLYKNDYPKYYLHYVKIGCHDPERRKTATGIKKMTNYCTRWAGVDYSKAYDFNYYMKRYPGKRQIGGV